jgi:hypothetical protein
VWLHLSTKREYKHGLERDHTEKTDTMAVIQYLAILSRSACLEEGKLDNQTADTMGNEKQLPGAISALDQESPRPSNPS